MAESSWYDRLDAAVGGFLPFGVEPGTSATELAQRGQPVVAPRGKTITTTSTVYPDGTTVPKSITPGGVALYSRDLTAYNKVVKIARRISPAKRARKGKIRRRR